jgi:hypothetical protein
MKGNRIASMLALAVFSLGAGKLNAADVAACVVGTNSLTIGARVTTSGGLACDSLSMESNAVANGGANINNVSGTHVRISGATLYGPVDIAGPAPSAANGELVNGGKIVGTVTTGAGQQATLATQTVSAGTSPITVNTNSPAMTIAPGNYGAVAIQGSTVTFTGGTYNLASLTIDAGTIVLNPSGSPIAINVKGAITINGGIFSSGSAANVTYYSDSNASTAVVINTGVTGFPGSITAPNGNVTIGSRVNVDGCVGAKNVVINPDTVIGHH